jgi:hypothetical protein
MQLSLQHVNTQIPHRQAIPGNSIRVKRGTYTCSHWIRPMGNLQYEHMFPSTKRASIRQRLSSAVELTRAFLLLEDDYDVDWEVDQDEREEFVARDTNGHPSVALRSELGGSEGDGHPHRVALRSRLGDRRPGVVRGHELVCVCPLPPQEARVREVGQRGSRISTGIVRVAIDR